MKSAGNHRSPIVSYYSFFALLAALILTILLVISCSAEESIVEPESEDLLDASLIRFTDFIHSSVPAHELNSNPQEANQNRALIYWYNQIPPLLDVVDILGNNVSVKTEKRNVLVLDLVFDPLKKGIYNIAELDSDLKNNWGGLFKNLPDHVSKKIYNKNVMMKIWMKIEDAPADAVLHIDLGKISEDIIPNLKLDTEDKNVNNLLDEGEDTGIDGLSDNIEPGYNNGNDPNKDNFFFNLTANFEKVNGLEGNAVSVDFGRKPDTEDINRNYTLDLSNDYYSYRIPLEINKIKQSRIIEYGQNGWFLLKIPVEIPDMRVGNPDKTKLETLRLWITNSNHPVHLKIAEIKFCEL